MYVYMDSRRKENTSTANAIQLKLTSSLHSSDIEFQSCRAIRYLVLQQTLYGV